MQVPDEFRKCVVFLAYNSTGGMKFAGTAFFVSIDPKQCGAIFVYLITARHVIAQIKSKSVDGDVLIRINELSGGFQFGVSRVDDWIFHPEDSSVDVALIGWAPNRSVFDYMTYPFEQFLTASIIKEERVGLGDEVFMAGLFASHSGKRRNVPVIRIGNIACVPEEPVDTQKFGPMDAYIIEARSIGGLSGSPVFVNLSGIRTKESTVIGGTRHYLLGLIHGHWDVLENAGDAILLDNHPAMEGRINMGMAIVVPAEKVSEVLMQPMLVQGRQIELDKLINRES